jgi:hypothetical protein
MKERDRPGKISLTGIFAAIASELMGAATRGRMLHRTKNIRDSGAPFEIAVRQQLSELLPRAFSVHQGYLFDAAGTCTAQLDAFLCSAVRAQAVFSAPEGATYSPFSDAWSIGEIKASSKGMAGHLTQISDRIRAVEKMRLALRHERAASFPDLVSFLIVGECQASCYKAIAQHWAARGDEFPDYIVLLGPGELILPPSMQLPLFDEDSQEVSPLGTLSSQLSAWSSDGDLDQKRGSVLSWFFFALLHRLRLAESHDLKIAWSAISVDEGASYTGVPERVAGLLSRSADPFSLAVMHNMRLKSVRQLNGGGPKFVGP